MHQKPEPVSHLQNQKNPLWILDLESLAFIWPSHFSFLVRLVRSLLKLNQ